MLISVKEIINKSIDLYKANARLFLRYMLILFIPTGIISLAAAMMGSLPETLSYYGLLSWPSFINGLIYIVGSLIGFWVSIAFVRVAAARYQNQEPKNLKEEMQTALSLFLPAIGVSLLASLIILGGSLLLIIPGLIFAVWLAFAFYQVILDNKKIREALSASKQLVRGRWWKVLWRLLAPALLFIIVSFLIQVLLNAILGGLFRFLSQGFNSLTSAAAAFLYLLFLSFTTLLNLAVNLFFTPLTTAAPTILYLELKKTPSELHPRAEPPRV